MALTKTDLKKRRDGLEPEVEAGAIPVAAFSKSNRREAASEQKPWQPNCCTD